ncbi:hypothetical protein CsSME_00029734 [Camellia sinensis var. sinensis]
MKEEDDEEEEENMDIELGKLSSTADPHKKAKMQSILSQFTEEQMSRYESFRRSGFQKSNMKRVCFFFGLLWLFFFEVILYCILVAMNLVSVLCVWFKGGPYFCHFFIWLIYMFQVDAQIRVNYKYTS